MDLAALRHVRTIVKTGSVSRAAHLLNCVQSNVTARLRNLEDNLGTPLFIRTRQGMIPTPAGETLDQYADRILALVDEAAQAVKLSAEGGGPLSIASMETTAAVRMPPVLAAFHAKYPSIEISLRTGTSASVIDDVLNRRVDAGLIAGPYGHPDIHAQEVFNEELVMIDDGDSRKKTAILTFRVGCVYRAMAENWIGESNQSTTLDVMEFGTLDGILGCVAAGMGCAILPRSLVERSPYAPKFRVTTLGGSMTCVSTMFIWRRDAPTHKARDTLMRLLMQASGAA